ncbi:hypothetical protein F5Y09DRAFT_296353 [Xylaria sp. FL1042]|nr:hypothetical protein F5Y09DRAFT_296353 [Xylaria sp. FL1042]
MCSPCCSLALPLAVVLWCDDRVKPQMTSSAAHMVFCQLEPRSFVPMYDLQLPSLQKHTSNKAENQPKVQIPLLLYTLQPSLLTFHQYLQLVSLLFITSLQQTENTRNWPQSA